MTKEELIEQLSKIEGNPEVFIAEDNHIGYYEFDFVILINNENSLNPNSIVFYPDMLLNNT